MLLSEGDFQPLNKIARTYLHLVLRRDGLIAVLVDSLVMHYYQVLIHCWPYFLGDKVEGNPSSSGNLHAVALVQGYELGTRTHDFIIPLPFTRY